ncbi:PREDICTED: F-box protein At5g07610-like [Fragaria vesca subsp. vesca]|uniref:F-box protein At5g07610-like n=1 Tax=Fragaria vesca subsp. vesca TaxID=101020 RepID=UPI0002C31A68|nr:PREDICTED: F-box protein At5g07610-like [Fragaria vesca subsp. vesca]
MSSSSAETVGKLRMSSSSAETVANIEELLKHILISVPALSLIRFKSVSKHWLSVISDPDFRRRHTLRNPNPKISAFFSPKTKHDAINSVISLGSPAGNPFKDLTSSAFELRILQSCNGLFLCSVEIAGEEETKYPHPVFVVNPTTNEFRALSAPSLVKLRNVDMFVRYGLAFDPSKSPHYTVVCVNHDINRGKRHNVEMYSSETGAWGRSFKARFFPSPLDENLSMIRKAMHFDERSRKGAVYCNGAVHWIRNGRKSRLPLAVRCNGEKEFIRDEVDVLRYFDIGEESLRLTAAIPPVPLVVKNMTLDNNKFPTVFPKLSHKYFGESGGGCLYMIEVFEHCKNQFEVMEMERDYSGWNKSFKTSVELANRKLFLALDDEYDGDHSPYMETLACV